MNLTFRSYDSSRCGYPAPHVPVIPPFDHFRPGQPAPERYPTCFDVSGKGFLSKGRYALFHALTTLGVDERCSVLIPAYHCRTMIDPVLRVGANVLLFALTPKLAPDMPHLQALVSSASPPVKALLLPHFFGFPQDVEMMASFCNERGIALIEDCCHAYFGSWRGRTLGTWGACAIGSPGKFIACEDGGTYYSSNTRCEFPLDPPSFSEEVRAAHRSAERALAHLSRRLHASRSTDLERHFEAIREQYPQGSATTTETLGSDLSRHYQLELESREGLRLSRRLIQRSNVGRLATRRYANFEALLEGTRELPNCSPLFTDLHEGVVPYMFPLLIEQPERRFHWLKHLGVPIYRWDELAVSECPVSADYRLRLLHLPCHQALHDDDIEWLLRALTVVMNARIDGPGSV